VNSNILIIFLALLDDSLPTSEVTHRGIKLTHYLNNGKVWRGDIFKPTIWNESLYETNNDNGVGLLNFATSTNLIVESTVFPHRNIHTLGTSDGKTHNQTDQSSVVGIRSFTGAD
jgi:hypothetical protein